MSELECVTIEPPQPAKFTVIWLHGLGADGNDFVSIVDELTYPEKQETRFIFPHAPVRPVTINGNMPMRAWYDILGIDFHARQDQTGVLKSVEQINQLIETQHQCVGSENIILGGFSQGGAIALSTLLSTPFKLRGTLALSCYLPIDDYFANELANHNLNTPIFMLHGQQDPIVLCAWGEQSYRQIKQWGHTIDFKTYPMQHNVCIEEINDIDHWLSKQLKH